MPQRKHVVSLGLEVGGGDYDHGVGARAHSRSPCVTMFVALWVSDALTVVVSSCDIGFFSWFFYFILMNFGIVLFF